jgi:NADH:ubiquinone oxidoreductase subunit 4 (subunit M)
VLLVLLTAFLGPLVVAGAFSAIQKDIKLFYAMVFFIQFAMLGTFVAQDLLLFYIFWETMLIPMFLIIGIWGGERRIYATLKFVLYTAFGSILMLAALIYLVWSQYQADGHAVVRLRRPVRHQAQRSPSRAGCWPRSRCRSRSRCRWCRCTPGCPTRTSRRRPPAA